MSFYSYRVLSDLCAKSHSIGVEDFQCVKIEVALFIFYLFIYFHNILYLFGPPERENAWLSLPACNVTVGEGVWGRRGMGGCKKLCWKVKDWNSPLELVAGRGEERRGGSLMPVDCPLQEVREIGLQWPHCHLGLVLAHLARRLLKDLITLVCYCWLLEWFKVKTNNILFNASLIAASSLWDWLRWDNRFLNVCSID